MAIYRIGYNFRATSGFVTDPSDTIGWEAELYPTAKNMTTSGLSVTAGWDFHAGGHRDRNSGVDARLAGIDSLSLGGGSVMIFRVDLPVSGAWDIRLAAGDANFQQRAFFDIVDSDTTTVLYAQADADTVAPEEYFDAQGVLRTTAADWVSNNSPRTVTFAGTAAYLHLKAPPAGSSAFAHLSFYKDTGGGSTPSLPPQQSTRIAPLLRF